MACTARAEPTEILLALDHECMHVDYHLACMPQTHNTLTIIPLLTYTGCLIIATITEPCRGIMASNLINHDL